MVSKTAPSPPGFLNYHGVAAKDVTSRAMSALAPAFRRPPAPDDDPDAFPGVPSTAPPEVDARVDLTHWLALGGVYGRDVIESAAAADAAKRKGNALFAEGAHDDAIFAYTEALTLVPEDKTFDEQRVRPPVCTPILGPPCLGAGLAAAVLLVPLVPLARRGEAGPWSTCLASMRMPMCVRRTSAPCLNARACVCMCVCVQAIYYGNRAACYAHVVRGARAFALLSRRNRECGVCVLVPVGACVCLCACMPPSPRGATRAWLTTVGRPWSVNQGM